jgi:DNA-binding YbaB/EbfC family protein
MKNLEDIMKMAATMQAEIEKAQATLEAIEVEGVSGGGLVKVRATAKGRVNGLDIDVSLLSPDSKEMTEDLVVAAFNDARAKAEEAAGRHMQALTAAMPMPPGFRP